MITFTTIFSILKFTYKSQKRFRSRQRNKGTGSEGVDRPSFLMKRTELDTIVTLSFHVHVLVYH